MTDFRDLLKTLDTINEAGQRWDDLDKIVNSYAKKGMDFNDLIQMEKEARKAEPPDLSDEEKSGFTGFFRNLGRAGAQLASTKDFRVKYVLAHAAKKLGLPGLYDSKGKNLNYLDDKGEAQTVGTANKSEATKINDAGLLPDNIAKKFKLEPKATSARTYGIGDPLAPKVKAGKWVDPDAGDAKDASQTKTDSNVLHFVTPGFKSIDRNSPTANRDARAAWGKLYKTYRSLVRKVNESAPVSLRGYLTEGDIAMLLAEALTPQESVQLRNAYNDLLAMTKWGVGVLDKQTLLQIKSGIANAPESIKGEKSAAAPKGTPAPVPQADIKKTSQAVDDEPFDIAAMDKADRKASGSLHAFLNSGEGGLANNPEETAAIKELQAELVAGGFMTQAQMNTGPGIYGPKTMAAVKAFQKAKGLKVDGDAGPNTIAMILNPGKPATKPAAKPSDKLPKVKFDPGFDDGDTGPVDFKSIEPKSANSKPVDAQGKW